MKRILHRLNHLKAGAVKDVFEIAKCTKATREFMLGGMNSIIPMRERKKLNKKKSGYDIPR